MITKKMISEILPSIWPLIAFISVVSITLRGAYLSRSSKKFIFHKELMSLIFIVYIICLYYILMKQGNSSNNLNLIPFKEMFKYEIGSYHFFSNIIGNILIFVPLGYFASYYLTNIKASVIVIVSIIISLFTEGLQYYLGNSFDIDNLILNTIGGFLGYLLYVALNAIKGKLPKFMKSDGFLNFVVILIIILILLFSFDINILNYL